MMKAPCADCSMKGCGSYHSQCDRYKEYLKLHSEEMSQVRSCKTVEHLLRYHKKH